MQYTNDLNLPQPIADAIINDPYSSGDADISITSLISPPQKVALEKLYQDQITRDVSDEIYALMGKSIHNILEQADTSAIKEQRLYIKESGWTISGQFDRLCMINKSLQDYKMASVYEYINGVKQERYEQLNCYAEMIRQNYPEDQWPEKLEVIYIFRDWSKRKAQFDKNYPKHQVAVIEIEMWDSDATQWFIKEHVAEHQMAREAEGSPRACRDSERWKEPTKYALMKMGRKRAIKLYTNAEEAEEARAKDTGLDLYIETRHGEATRCLHYCNASPFCNQFKNEQKIEEEIVFKQAMEGS